MIEHLRQTATWFEVAWTVPAFLVGIVWSVILYLVSGDAVFWHTWHPPERDVDPEMHWADGQVMQKIIMMLVLIIITAFGAVAMWSPPVVQPAPPPTRVTYMLTFTFISIPSLLLLYGVIYLIARARTKRADDRRTANMRRRSTDVNPVPVVIYTKIEEIEGETEQ